MSADLRTGQILAYLPGIVCDYPLRHTISLYDTATVHLYLDGAPENWERAVQEGASVLAMYDETVPTNPVVWAGMVVTQTRNAGSTSDVVDLDLATVEAYFDRRMVDDVTYTSTGQNAVVAGLIASFVADGAAPGLANLVVAYVDPGTVITQTYATTDWASVYSRMTQLSATQGGPEFTVTWAFSADGMSLVPTLTIADRLGSSAPAGLAPATRWGMPGCVSVAQQIRDYSAGKGANRVRAYSSSTLYSDYQLASDFQGRPSFDYVWSPSSSITDAPTLTSYAMQAVALVAPGSIALTLTAAITAAPVLGSDWFLGDDVAYSIGGLDEFGNDTVLAFPGGLTGIGRSIAVEIGGTSGYMPTTISPILAQTAIYTDPGS